MLYDLSKDLDRQSFKTKVNSLYKKGGMVEVTDKSARSKRQNRYLHLILGYFALQLGYSLDLVKREFFKKACNKDLFVRQVHDELIGDIEELRSSRDLTVQEMTDAIDRFRKWSSEEAGIYLPSANEEAYMQQLEYEVNRNAKWL